MGRCIIHIGMHKTGSSSIQVSLDGFSDDRHLYARLGRAPNHSLPIYSLFSSEPERHQLHRLNAWDAAAIEEYNASIKADVDAALAAVGERTLIISGEDISVLPPSDVDELRDYFSSQSDSVEIVGYVRPPAGFIASGFQQRVKGGLGRFNLDLEYRNYRSTFGKFDEVFGRANVHLWKFDPKTFPAGCVVRDFCTRLGIQLPVERIKRVNESLSRQAVALLYIYRKFGELYGFERMGAGESQKLGRLLAAVGEDKFRFSPDVIRPILEKNRADIEWMEGRLGASLHEELGEYQAGDVRGEADLLTPDPEVVSRLLTLLGDRAPQGVKGKTPKEVALLVHALRGKPTGSVPSESVQAARAEARRNTGKVMRATPNAIVGWAIGADMDRPVRVALLVNGEAIASAVADKPRPALKERGIHPTGRCGFAFRFEAGRMLQPGDEVMVKPVDADFAIGNSPCAVREAAKAEMQGVELENEK